MATASWADGIANSRRGSTEKEGGDKGEEILDAHSRVTLGSLSSSSVSLRDQCMNPKSPITGSTLVLLNIVWYPLLP